LKINEVENTADELQRTRQHFEQKVSHLEAEQESQKLELTHDFEDALKRQEREFQGKEEEFRNQCFSLEMKVR